MSIKSVNILRLGDKAPDFVAETTEGRISFHSWLGDSWCVFFSHPRDFTPVCTTELGVVAKLKSEFEKRKAKVISLSVNSVESHMRWISDINETQHTKVNYPMVGDEDGTIADLYGMIHPKMSDASTVRSVFIIDPQKTIRLMISYPAATGRNFQEILRVLDALQLTDSHKVATPANWKPGDDCIILPSITDPQELKKLFPKGYKEIRPYLRITPQPDK